MLFRSDEGVLAIEDLDKKKLFRLFVRINNEATLLNTQRVMRQIQQQQQLTRAMQQQQQQGFVVPSWLMNHILQEEDNQEFANPPEHPQRAQQRPIVIPTIRHLDKDDEQEDSSQNLGMTRWVS